MGSKQVLLDIKKELEGYCIEDTFEVHGHSFKMRLLDESENRWVLGFVPNLDFQNIKTLMSIRVPMLAAGVREIDGNSVSTMFDEDWDKLSEDEKESLFREHGSDSKLIFVKNSLRDLLDKFPPEWNSELYAKWTELEARRRSAQDLLKNS
jgi:hypothetical protein